MASNPSSMICTSFSQESGETELRRFATKLKGSTLKHSFVSTKKRDCNSLSYHSDILHT